MDDVSQIDCTPLSSACIKGLTDRDEGKRKYAAAQIEKMTLEFSLNKNVAMVDRLVNLLGKRFCLSLSVNARKGGLIGLAALLVGFQNGSDEPVPCELVDNIVRPILTCLQDPDPFVRYCACEALYNVIKVTKSNISGLFLDIFDNLTKVIADLDLNVRNAAEMIDKLLKDVVCENNIIELKPFVAKLREYLYTRNTFTRMLVISWIRLIESIESDMISHLPEILDGLFHCLYDSTEEIRASLLPTMSEFLNKIVSQQNRVESCTMMKFIEVLSRELETSDNPTVKLEILEWFIKLKQAQPDVVFADFYIQQKLLDTLIETLSDSSDDVVKATLKVLADVLCFGSQESQNIVNDLVTFDHGINSKEDESSEAESSRKSPVRNHLSNTKTAKKVAISSNDPSAVGLQTDTTNIDKFMNALYKLFKEQETVFNERASFIIIHLSGYLKAEIIYRSFALQLIDENQDLKFAYHLVQKLNELLFKAKALHGLRSKLCLACEDGNIEAMSLFHILYQAWCHSPIATLSICFLTNNYKLAAEIVASLTNIDVTLDCLIEIDKLVQLIESPIFISMRLKLLESDNFYLIKSLYGLLMVLPQSEAFRKLRARLECVYKFQASSQPRTNQPTIVKSPTQTAQKNFANTNKEIRRTFPTQDMMKQFQNIQTQHLRLRISATSPTNLYK